MDFSKITDKNELAKIDKFEREYPEFGDCGFGIFATQEHDENGRAVRGNSVSILFDAGRYDSIDIAIELAKFYVKLRDGFNMRGKINGEIITTGLDCCYYNCISTFIVFKYHGFLYRYNSW